MAAIDKDKLIVMWENSIRSCNHSLIEGMATIAVIICTFRHIRSIDTKYIIGLMTIIHFSCIGTNESIINASSRTGTSGDNSYTDTGILWLTNSTDNTEVNNSI